MPRSCNPTSIRGLVAAAAVLVFLALPTTGFGAPQQQGQQPTTLRLSLDRALRLALEHNLDIAVINYDRRIARQNIVAQSGATH